MRFLLILACAAACGLAMAEPVLVTGSRHWRMADGTTKRLRFTGFEKDPAFVTVQERGEAPHPMYRSAFSKEEDKAFQAFKDGSSKLVTTPGLCIHPNYPSGKLFEEMRKDGGWRFGETRAWQLPDGKKVEGKLACLTDEEVSVLSNDAVGTIPLGDLSAEDKAYIERVKRGEARVFVERVRVYDMGWESLETGGQKSPHYRISTSGEHYAALAKLEGNPGGAREAALKHIQGKLKADQWELLEVSEQDAQQPNPHTPYDSIKPTKEKACVIYTVKFLLKKGGEREAGRHWPLTATPKSWRGTKLLHIHVFADGTVATAELDRQ